MSGKRYTKEFKAEAVKQLVHGLRAHMTAQPASRAATNRVGLRTG
jgi:transposase-like protein